MNVKIQKVISEIENEEKRLASQGERTNWIIEREAIQWICEQVRERRPGTIVECGTSVGYSTIWLAQAAHEYGGSVISIERDSRKVQSAKANIAKTDLENIKINVGDATEILEHWDGQTIDFLFLDANKKGYLPQFLAVKEYMQEGSLVIADNIIDMQERLQSFISYMVDEEPDFKSRIIERWDGLLIAEKVA